jgi:hypothetical protein
MAVQIHKDPATANGTSSNSHQDQDDMAPPCWNWHISEPVPGRKKSRPGMTPCGLLRDCRFPSSAAAMITGERREGSSAWGLVSEIVSVRDKAI